MLFAFARDGFVVDEVVLRDVRVLDLPGTYALGGVSEDQWVARRALLEIEPSQATAGGSWQRIGERAVVPGGHGSKVEDAERQTAFVMGLLSSVALLTGFFIILSTLSMGMVERIAQQPADRIDEQHRRRRPDRHGAPLGFGRKCPTHVRDLHDHLGRRLRRRLRSAC